MFGESIEQLTSFNLPTAPKIFTAVDKRDGCRDMAFSKAGRLASNGDGSEDAMSTRAAKINSAELEELFNSIINDPT